MTGGTKHQTAVARRDGVDHDQLVAHWRDPHAPGVRALMKPDRYAVTFFDPRGGKAPFDGLASLAWDDADVATAHTGANIPAEVAGDGFVDLAALPMARSTVVEHVIVAGPSGEPATIDEREGAHKMTFLVSALDGVDLAEVHRHWLTDHAPNVASDLVASGGIRYVVNLADTSSGDQPYAGIAELWYADGDAAKAHQPADDGFGSLVTAVALPGRELVVSGG